MEYPLNALGLSHKFIAEHVVPGARCIDATAGRGRDTLFLAGLVGKEGEVLAFDVQPEAIESTGRLLAENGIQNAHVFLDSHEHLDRYAAPESVDAIMFNLGWLPSGDHAIFSHGATSSVAISKGLELLKPGGVMSVCIYYGKETGYEERDTLLAFLKTVDPTRFTVVLNDFLNRKGEPPIAVFLWKEN